MLGALTTYTEIQKHPVLQAEFPLLCTAARETGSIATQNRGTLGGNIVNASPAADSPPALLVYDAEIELVSERGVRWLPYHGFHTGYKKMHIAPDELLRAVRLPRRAKPWTQYYRKVGTRKAQAISKVCFAGAALVESGTRSRHSHCAGQRRARRDARGENGRRAARTKLTPDDHRRGERNSGARNRADRRYSLDRALPPARRAKPARRISLAAREMKTIHAIRSKRVVTPEGVKAATMHLRNGMIAAIARLRRISLRAKTFMTRENPSSCRGWWTRTSTSTSRGAPTGRDFDTATRAAAAGGVTTLIDMPLNSIPATTTAAALEKKRTAARKKCWVNVGFWGGVVPGNTGDLRALASRRRIWVQVFSGALGRAGI